MLKRTKIIFCTLLVVVLIESLILLNNQNLSTKFEEGSKRPNSEAELLNTAQKFFHDGQYEQTVKAYQMALNFTANKENIYLQLANTYRYWGKYEDSEKMFKKALEVNPKNDSTYTDLGKLSLKFFTFGSKA